MKIAKRDAQVFHNGPTCTVHKYAFPSPRLGLISAEMHGRYPERGKVLNELCDETYFVLAGSCTIHYETGDYTLSEGDLFFFPRGKWWWAEASGLRSVVCTAPPWTPEQHRQLD